MILTYTCISELYSLLFPLHVLLLPKLQNEPIQARIKSRLQLCVLSCHIVETDDVGTQSSAQSLHPLATLMSVEDCCGNLGQETITSYHNCYGKIKHWTIWRQGRMKDQMNKLAEIAHCLLRDISHHYCIAYQV